MNDTSQSNIEHHQRAMDVLRAALDAAPAERRGIVDRLSAGDAALRTEALSLLDALERAGDFLQTPALRLDVDANADNAGLLIGRRIGRYTIRSLLGRGGMGAVFLAEQDEPRREVALKILPASMLALSRDALRRFQREARALARLQHAGIAAIHEAGTHDDGSGATPFFAMEHIGGAKTIAAYASDGALSLRERLDLFLQACDAVQFGHQRGVIHRDLKPANILVNAQGQVKVIDFGVARLLHDDDATDGAPAQTATVAGRPLGTPAYMSPEQFGGEGRDLDIRTDVFALGVVLGELLHDVEAAGIGDLRTIFGKATAEERDRRYQSVADLARDVRRLLNHQPIEARPPSALYSVRLFVRRNRTMVAAATLALGLLLAAIVGTTFGLMRARAAERVALEESQRYRAISGFLTSMFRSPDPAQMGRDVKVLDLLQTWEGEIDRQFAHNSAVQSSLHTEIGLAYMELGDMEAAEPHLLSALEVRRATLGERHDLTQASVTSLATMRHRQTRLAESETLYEGAVRILLEIRGPDDQDTMIAQNGYALLLKDLGRLDEAERLFRDLIDRRLRLLGRMHNSTASSMNNLALVLRERGALDEAERLYRDVLEIDLEVRGEKDVRTAATMNNLAALLRAQGRLDEAEPMFRRTLEIRRELLGDDHRDVLLSMNNLSMLMVSRRNLAEAEPLLRETMEAHRRALGDNAQGTMIVTNNYARLLADLHRTAEALPLFERVVASARTAYGEEHWRVAWYRAFHGSALAAAGRFEEAEPMLLDAYEAMSGKLGEADAQTRRVAQFVVDMYTAQGRTADALAWRERAEGVAASQPAS